MLDGSARHLTLGARRPRPWRAVALAMLAVVPFAVGTQALAPPAGAAEVPVDGEGCPAGGDPSGALPCVTVTLTCVGLEVNLSNGVAAGSDGQFTISTSTTTTSVTVSPGDTEVHTVPVLEDQTVGVTVAETTTSQTFIDRSVTRDCTAPSATVGTLDCADGALVSVSNPGGSTGTAPATFQVDVYAGGSATPTSTSALEEVVGDASTQVLQSVDGSLRVVVTASTANGTGLAPATQVVADRTQAVDCQDPTATVTLACAEAGDGLLATVAAGPDQPEELFDVTFSTEAGVATVTDQEVPAGTSVGLTVVSPGEGKLLTVDVREAGEDTVLASDSTTVDCVGAERAEATTTTTTVVAGDDLPRTGPTTDPAVTAVAGLALVAIGLGLVRLRRRPI